MSHETDHGAPTSWAEDLNQYRSQRGCLSYSFISEGKDVPKRFARTSLVPFADTGHPLYSYQEPTRSAYAQDVISERYKRHGGTSCSLSCSKSTKSWKVLVHLDQLVHRVEIKPTCGRSKSHDILW